MKITIKREQSQTCLSFAERKQLAGVSRKITIKREQSHACLGLPSVRKSGGQERAEDKLAWTMPNGSHLHEVNLREAKNRKVCLILILLAGMLFSAGIKAQENVKAGITGKSEQEKKAAEWASSLNLNDPEKEKRVSAVVAAHLTTIRNWHNEHPASTVPAGINPVTGNPLTELDRQIIADSAMPKSVHEALMNGLRADLSEEQVEAILDKYTVGKVAFTMKGYHAIVPDLTPEEETTILGFLKEAREMAVDYKSMKQISAVFEIYKTKSEQYLISRGRNWRELYKIYVNYLKEQKAKEKKK